MNRRSFLGTMAGGMAFRPPERTRVLVAGAGMAGLTAASELVQAGYDVVILEARARPGGRVYTLRAPFSDGLYAEAGAARIPDNHNLTLEYVRRFGLALEPFYPVRGAALFSFGGRSVKVAPGGEPDLNRLPVELTAEERKLGLDGMWEKYVFALTGEMGDAAAPDWPPASLKAYDEMTFPDFLRHRGASPGAVELLEVPFVKPEWDRSSALWTLRAAVLERTEKGRFKIRGGMELLPRALAARLKDRIRYGAAVVRIEQDALGVRVTFRAGGAHHTEDGHYLLCTLPFPTLSRVETAPAFSEGKRRAIAELAYDSVTRVFLQARRRFWERGGLNGFARTDLPAEIWHPTHSQSGPRGILNTYTYALEALRLAEMPEEKRIAETLRQVDDIFPGMRDEFETGVSHSWDKEEWSRGAYAFHNAGQISALGPHAALPEGRVHFAGEHVSSMPSWIQGAISSGLRAAREIRERTA